MKNKMELKKIFAMAMVAVMSSSLPAIAATVTSESADVIKAEKVQQEMQYQLVSGVISSIESTDGSVSIQLSDKADKTASNGLADIKLIANVNDYIRVIDQKDMSEKSVADLKEGTKVSLLLLNNSPMTMSLPPMTNGVDAIIIESDSNFMDLSFYNEELVNAENQLKLNIDEKTKISDLKGSKKVFTADDVKNKEALVFYGASTRSIPAQTSPTGIIVFDKAEMEEDSTAQPEAKPEVLPEIKPEVIKPNAPFALRAYVEGLGYTVLWSGNDQPVVISKEGRSIKLTLNEKGIEVNGEKKELSSPVTLVNGQMTVPADFADSL